MRKIYSLLAVTIFWVTACSSGNAVTGGNPNLPVSEPVSVNKIMSLLCGSQTNCLSTICASTEKCPLVTALSNKAVFDFVKTYSECEGCNTPVFTADKGIGKCVEFKIAELLQTQKVTFWVSENCKFRHGSPTQSRIVVKINKKESTIKRIDPAVAYIKDREYCSIDSDCNGLSGSGVPLIGCSNFLYAPLNWSGYYSHSSDTCTCAANRCKQK
ncbi:MAG: hypothetical protein RBS68_13655 [Anaerolineales bacterium]|nr:hypothetical protein [Anaerolineales bacterium]